LAKISDEGANSQLLFVLLEWLVSRISSVKEIYADLALGALQVKCIPCHYQPYRKYDKD